MQIPVKKSLPQSFDPFQNAQPPFHSSPAEQTHSDNHQSIKQGKNPHSAVSADAQNHVVAQTTVATPTAIVVPPPTATDSQQPPHSPSQVKSESASLLEDAYLLLGFPFAPHHTPPLQHAAIRSTPLQQPVNEHHSSEATKRESSHANHEQIHSTFHGQILPATFHESIAEDGTVSRTPQLSYATSVPTDDEELVLAAKALLNTQSMRSQQTSPVRSPISNISPTDRFSETDSHDGDSSSSYESSRPNRPKPKSLRRRGRPRRSNASTKASVDWMHSTDAWIPQTTSEGIQSSYSPSGSSAANGSPPRRQRSSSGSVRKKRIPRNNFTNANRESSLQTRTNPRPQRGQSSNNLSDPHENAQDDILITVTQFPTTELIATTTDYPAPEIPQKQHQSKSPSPTRSPRGVSKKHLHKRRCDYCGATSTPMWRHGPPEYPDLCNKCGVKYMRGRILQANDMIPQTEIPQSHIPPQ